MPSRSPPTTLLVRLTIVFVLAAIVTTGVSIVVLMQHLREDRIAALDFENAAMANSVNNLYDRALSAMGHIAQNEVVEKFNLSYNNLALEAFLAKYSDMFDSVAIVGRNNEMVVSGRGDANNELRSFLTTRRDTATNLESVFIVSGENGQKYVYISKRYFNYFDVLQATVSALISPERILNAVAINDGEHNIYVSIGEKNKRLVIADPLGIEKLSPNDDFILPRTSMRAFHREGLFTECNCVAFSSPLRYGEQHVYIAHSRESFYSSERTLRFVLVTGGLVVVITAIGLLWMFNDANRRILQLSIADQKTKFKSEFLARVSHELRTPLNAIIGYSEMMREETHPDEDSEAHRDLGRIHSSACHLLNIINQLLDIQKIAAGKMDINIEKFSLNDVIDETIAQLAPLSSSKKQRLSAVLPSEPIQMTSDRTKIKQIVTNLLSNAIKFSDENAVTETRVESFQINDAPWIRIVVTDQGPGISKQDLERVFQEFSQLQSSSRYNSLGSGLGLAITKQLSELLGGGIVATSEVGRGTVFTIELPTIANENAEPEQKA